MPAEFTSNEMAMWLCKHALHSFSSSYPLKWAMQFTHSPCTCHGSWGQPRGLRSGTQSSRPMRSVHEDMSYHCPFPAAGIQHCTLTSEVAVRSTALVCSTKGLAPFLENMTDILYKANVLVFTPWRSSGSHNREVVYYQIPFLLTLLWKNTPIVQNREA